MGAWGVLALDNDDANDWANDLDHVSDFSAVEGAFSAVEDVDDYLEAPEASKALAACEVLARQLGHFAYRNSYTEKVDRWVAQHPLRPSPALLARALSVIVRIVGENSELRELWDEDDANNWLEAIEDLRNGLRE